MDKVVDTYKSTIAEACHVSKDVLYSSDSVFDDFHCASDGQWKAAELEQLHDAIREKLKTASYSEKIQILTLIPDKWSQEYASKQFDVSEYLVKYETARELKKVGGILAKPAPKNCKTLSQETLNLVQSFYEDDEYSRQMPGSKDYVSIDWNVHKQKRLVLCNVSELYNAIRDKYPNIKIVFSKFCTLRPKWCVLAGPSGIHSVCVCSTHQNAVLLVDAIDWPYTYKDLIKKVVCDPDKKVFIMHHCESCLKSAALKKFLDDELSHLDMDSNSIIVSGKQQIVLYWLHLQQHSKNTRNSSLTSSTTLLDTHTWQKSKQDKWNRRNLSVRTRLWCLGTSQRTVSIWSRTRYKASTGAKSIAHCIP